MEGVGRGLGGGGRRGGGGGGCGCYSRMLVTGRCDEFVSVEGLWHEHFLGIYVEKPRGKLMDLFGELLLGRWRFLGSYFGRQNFCVCNVSHYCSRGQRNEQQTMLRDTKNNQRSCSYPGLVKIELRKGAGLLNFLGLFVGLATWLHSHSPLSLLYT